MTDDESRKAFEEWSIQYYGYTHAYPADADAWQAAVEWATKRERERCIDAVNAHSLVYDRSEQMLAEIRGDAP